jgi:hypothetical protein
LALQRYDRAPETWDVYLRRHLADALRGSGAVGRRRGRPPEPPLPRGDRSRPGDGKWSLPAVQGWARMLAFAVLAPRTATGRGHGGSEWGTPVFVSLLPPQSWPHRLDSPPRSTG